MSTKKRKRENPDEEEEPIKKRQKLEESENRDIEWLTEDKKTEKSKQLKELYTEYIKKRNEIIQARTFNPPQQVKNYVFKDWENKDVSISDLFGTKNDLIIIHNMGTTCPYCTMWADGFNGVIDHLEDRCAFVVVSKDDIKTQKEFATKRKWRFKMVSAKDNTFTDDMNFESENSGLKPGVSTFYKQNEVIYRNARDSFGGNDTYQAVFQLFRLLKSKDEWNPKFEY